MRDTAQPITDRSTRLTSWHELLSLGWRVSETWIFHDDHRQWQEKEPPPTTTDTPQHVKSKGLGKKLW